MKVVVAPSAREDMLGVWSYIAQDSESAADRLVERILATISLLASSPFAGERCDEFGLGLRHIFVGAYVIFYHAFQEEDKVEVKAVIHGARDLPQELSRRRLQG
jgi:toxin ParE1/3/4